MSIQPLYAVYHSERVHQFDVCEIETDRIVRSFTYTTNAERAVAGGFAHAYCNDLNSGAINYREEHK